MITTDELKQFKSKLISDTDLTNNGGRMSTIEIISDVKNNVFPDVSQSQREAGIIQYRKSFLKVENPDDEIMDNVQIHLIEKREADDIITIFKGTQTNVEDDITSPTEYGIGNLNDDVLAGANEIKVEIQTPDLTIFRIGDIIWISNGVHEEYYEIDSVSKTLNIVTIGLVGVLANSFNADDTLVASVITETEIKTDFDDWVDNNNGGEYNISTYPLKTNNLGTVYDEWTLVFKEGGTTFECSGLYTGALDDGNIATDYAPVNPNYIEPFFIIDKDGWGTGWEEGDTITFSTIPAAVSVWRKRNVPLGSAAVANAGYTIRFKGDTAGLLTTTTTEYLLTTTTTE